MVEKLVTVVNSFKSGSSVVVVIPDELGIKAGTRFSVKHDAHRIIYEEIKEAE